MCCGDCRRKTSLPEPSRVPAESIWLPSTVSASLTLGRNIGHWDWGEGKKHWSRVGGGEETLATGTGGRGRNTGPGMGGCLHMVPALHPHRDLLLSCSHLPIVSFRHMQGGAHRNGPWRSFCFLGINCLPTPLRVRQSLLFALNISLPKNRNLSWVCAAWKKDYISQPPLQQSEDM